jgi:hypothetical protein
MALVRAIPDGRSSGGSNQNFLGDVSNSHVPRVAALPRTFIEASRPKEIKAILKFGRDSKWPLKVTLASALNETDSLSITYQIDWEASIWENTEIGTEWFTTQFIQKGQEDGLGTLPCWTRECLL